MTQSNQGLVPAPVRTNTADDHGAAWSQRRRRRTVGGSGLPPITTILARPLYLIFSAVIGVNVGWLATTASGFSSEAVVQFANSSQDSLLVKQVGQTIERRATSQDILQRAAKALKIDDADLGGRVKAQWQQDSQLVTVDVKAPSAEEATDQANAVAKAMIDDSEASIADRLSAARTDANRLLDSGSLDSVEAEAARRSQLGSALAATQQSISAEAGDLTLADSAVDAKPAGLTKPIGAAIGLVAGLLLAALVTLLMGLRGLRVFSGRSLRVLLPDTAVFAPGQVAELAGQLVETGRSCIAVIALPGAHLQALEVARELRHFIRAHGHAVDLVDVVTLETRDQVVNLLGYDARQRIDSLSARHVLLPVVDADTESAALLEGQAGVTGIIVSTPQSAAATVVQQYRAFERGAPAVVLSR